MRIKLINLEIKNQQLAVLKRILKQADNSEFISYYKLNNEINSEELYESFVNKVTVFNYETYYENWIKKSLVEYKPVLFNGSFRYVAMTSGTGSMFEKHLPYSEVFIKDTIRSSRSLILKLIKMGISPFHFMKKVMTIGGSTSFDHNKMKITDNNYRQDLTAGFMSGIVFKESPNWFSFLYVPGPEIHALIDWKVKMDYIINHAKEYNIGTLTGFPSYVLPLLNSIIQRYKLNSIHDIWPNFKLYIHSGVAIDHYKSGLEACFEKKVDFFETYYATEGFFGYSASLNSDEMQLITNTNIFYEFTEVNETNFDEKQELKKEAFILPLWSLKPGVNYALVATNNSGLYRFIQGDTLIFSDVNKLHFKLTGRLSEMINNSGEIVPVKHFMEVFINYCQSNNYSQITEFFISTSMKDSISVYQWYIVSDVNSANDFDTLDEKLMEELILYRDYRNSGITAPCRIQFISNHNYVQFLIHTNKINGQSKMPRYLKGELEELFLIFMEDISE